MGPSPDPDRELVQKARDGDRSAFNQLILKYRNRVMGIATRMIGDQTEAEDLAQDVFVKVFHGLEDFQGDALFSTWLYRITTNSCLNQRKKRSLRTRMHESLEAAELILPTSSSNPHTLLERKELKVCVEKAIQALPREQRMVLVLRDIEWLSYEEIADCLALELGTVRSRLHRARLEVQERIKAVFSVGEKRVAESWIAER
ncbi:MAG: sigma-70 family RNA polymerase sigma factor [Deltaproteobacteria bacterium]|nr:MAG: sigma-70 family RNA polymerase sigma factor [Deltaproteobacteria bacterium]